jgi:NitT/TauT family transport system ATP-binding protein
MDDLVALWTRQPFSAVYVTHNLDEAVRMGHSIVVLSRCPGQIRETVHLEKPLNERSYGDGDLQFRQKYLWDMMRDEALAADSELVNV